jgi:hypothetical protein
MADEVYLHLAVTFSEDEETDDDGTGRELTASIELDEERNEGKSQFKPGDTAWLRIFTVPLTAEWADLQSTAGAVSGPTKAFSTMAVEEEEVTFANTDTGQTSKPILAVASVAWMGTPIPAAITVTRQGGLKLSKKGTGICLVSYTTEYRTGSIRVSTITKDPFKALVYTTASI